MWIQPLFLTFQLMVVSVTIATIVGVAGAWAASTLEASGGRWRLLSLFFLASMLASIAMPLILHAAAWEATAGKFGWLPLTQTGSRATGLTAYGAFGGLTACGWIHGLFGSAIVSLATWHGVRSTPKVVIDQAELDFSPAILWWRIRLPLAMPWLVTATLATSALAATEMTVVDLYGFRTVADEFYLYFAVRPTSISLVMICVVPIVIGCVLAAVVTSMRAERVTTRRDERVRQTSSSSRPTGKTIGTAALISIGISMLVLFVPLAGLFVKAGHQVSVKDDVIEARWSLRQTLETLSEAPVAFASEYGWTAILAGLTGVVALGIAWPVAAWARSNPRGGRATDVITIVAFLIPGPVVGLAVVTLFQSDVPGFELLYQRTLVPTVIALLFRAAPLAYWVMRAGYRMIDHALVDACRMDGSLLRRMWAIDRRILASSLFTALAGAAFMASGDVPATLPVIPPGVTTVGTRLFGLLHSGARQQEAALAIWYVGFIALFSMAGLILVQKCGFRRR